MALLYTAGVLGVASTVLGVLDFYHAGDGMTAAASTTFAAGAAGLASVRGTF